MELFQDFWSQYVDEVAYVNCIDRKDSYNNEISKADYPCKILWNRMYIWWNGVCNPCDFDYKSSLAIGSAKENSIKDIWLGEKFQNIRKLHLAANRDSCYPCNLCEL
jgi:radical SAM protein with 4Fe4S-binding SPASM domain